MNGETLIERGERRLRALRADDALRLHGWRSQERLLRASLNQEPTPLADHMAWFAKTLTRRDGFWAIYELEGRALGHVNAVQLKRDEEESMPAIRPIARQNRALEHSDGSKNHHHALDGSSGQWRWGFYIGEENAPRGEGRAMMLMTLDYAFEHCGVQIMLAQALKDNPTSQAVHEQLGFTKLHTPPTAYADDDRAFNYSLSASDWPQRREAASKQLAENLSGWVIER